MPPRATDSFQRSEPGNSIASSQPKPRTPRNDDRGQLQRSMRRNKAPQRERHSVLVACRADDAEHHAVDVEEKNVPSPKAIPPAKVTKLTVRLLVMMWLEAMGATLTTDFVHISWRSMVAIICRSDKMAHELRPRVGQRGAQQCPMLLIPAAKPLHRAAAAGRLLDIRPAENEKACQQLVFLPE